MATSLALQLKQLAVPANQAVAAHGDTHRVSFIYSHKEAAGIAREMFFYVGVNGLEELCNLDAGFEQYESTLFSSSTQYFERSIQTKDVNEKIDSMVNTFLIRLCPFLRFTCAQQALEWLIQKYRIHVNNVDTLIQSFLPYHDTDLFPRMLKLIDLKAHDNRKWSWLHPVQKSGIQLARQTLVNQCHSDPACLALITDMVPQFLSVYDQGTLRRHDRLALVMNFFCYTLLALVHSVTISERLLSALLPTLCRGLKSDLRDYKAASFVVLSRLMTKATLKTSLLETVMNGVCKHLNSSMSTAGIKVLVIMFQSQEIDKVTKKAYKRLSRMGALPGILAEMSASFEVSGLVAALLRRLVRDAVKGCVAGCGRGGGGAGSDGGGMSSSCYSSEDEGWEGGTPLTTLTMTRSILTSVSLDAATITLAARLLLENLIHYCSDQDKASRQETMEKIKNVIRIFETKHGDCLDQAVDGIMSGLTEQRERGVVKDVLNTAVSSLHHRLMPGSDTTLALSLLHHRSSVRLHALTYLMDNLHTMEDKASVKESFLARLQDDSPEVVTALLSKPQKLWSVFEDKLELTSALLARLKTLDTSPTRVSVVKELLGVLGEGPLCPGVEAAALSCLLLVSSEDSCPQLAQHVLTSPLGASSPVLAHLKKVWLPKVKKHGSQVGELCNLNTALFEATANALASHQSPVTVLEALRGGMDGLSSLRQKSLACVLLEVTLRLGQKVKDADTAARVQLLFTSFLHGFLQAKKLMSHKTGKSEGGESSPISEAVSQLCNGKPLPAPWWTDLLNKWITSLQVPQQLKDQEFWHEVSADSVTGRWLRAVINITSLLLGLKKDAAAHHFDALQKMCGCAGTYLRFLCVLWSGEHSHSLGVTSDLRGKSLQLTLTFLTSLSDSDIASVIQSPAPAVPCLVGLCGSVGGSVRAMGVELACVLSGRCPQSSALYRPLLDLVSHYKAEITADPTYLATALAGLKSKAASRRKSKQQDTLSTVLGVMERPDTPAFVAAALLQALSSIDSMDSLTPLLPLLARMLERESLTESQGSVVRLLLARYTDTVGPELAHDQLALKLLTQALKKPLVLSGGATVQLLAIKQVSKSFFASLPGLESQRFVAGALLDVLQTTADSTVSSAIRKVFRHVTLPADLLTQELTPVLQSAATSVREVKRMRREDSEEKTTFGSALWIRTTALLEVLQNKKKIPNSTKLVPFCFQILTKVLEVEDAGEGEYLKQLVLGVIHHLCKKHLDKSSDEKIDGKDLNLDSIVQCIRTSTSPQTHQHALLVLSMAAQIAPEQLVHSMMSVFTFMGASILRQDDSYSFQVITRILETVFPALVMACKEQGQGRVEDMVTMMVRVFVDAYPHIPQHRRPLVFSTLLRVVGVDTYLWRLLLVFVEGVATGAASRALGASAGVGGGGALDDSISAAAASAEQEGKSKAIDQVHVDFLISLVLEFSPLRCLQMAHQALQYLAKLPEKHTEGNKQQQKKVVRRQSPSKSASASGAVREWSCPEECEIFSLAHHSTRQLHKFRHATMVVLQQLMASTQFIAQLSEQLDEASLGALRGLMETLLVYMADTTRAVERHAASPQAPYWRGLLAKCTMLLDSLVSLLPQDQFLNVVGQLVDSELMTVQRKALEMLAARLRHLRDTPVAQEQKAVLLELVPKLQGLVSHLSTGSSSSSGGPEGEERASNAKVALYTLMLMARVLGIDYHVTFVQVLRQVSGLMSDDSVSNDAAATAMMCCAEIVSNMRAHTIVLLPQVVPPILTHLKQATSVQSEMLPCCVTSLHKVIDTLPHFLTPYTQDILTQICHIQTLLEDAPASEQRESILRSLKHTSKSMAALTPRVFLPAVEACYTALLESERQESVCSLLGVLGQHLGGLSREDLHLTHHQLVDFFLCALDFRVTQRKVVSGEVIDKTEGAVIETFLTMVLKMTEGTLRPMLLRIFEWAKKEGKRDRVITFYRLADSLAGRLKGLFLLFAANIFKYATQLLDLLHQDKAEESFLKRDKKGRKSCALLSSVLGCVQKVCLFDTQNFINKDRFSALMQPLLDQLENFVGGEEAYVERVKDCVVPAIADFAAAARNDSLWQTLNYQLMLKTRSKNKQVRLSSLYALKGLHKKLGEDYVSLMPETIPFLSELMEDECEEVEALTQEVIQEMEETFGESLQKYFN